MKAIFLNSFDKDYNYIQGLFFVEIIKKMASPKLKKVREEFQNCLFLSFLKN